ncbi:hypothetical protein [Catenuloplanes japonicus]|uniref:hypothetical protein n=1 Tax=Catenuloplanes japonicus TaxID=33876 RepID=UPI0022B6B364|nr:hypothetical protein [Catenuloplanes japonicus]
MTHCASALASRHGESVWPGSRRRPSTAPAPTGPPRSRPRLGIDGRAHGEPARNDMVPYVGEQLDGFTLPVEGGVQSF